MSRPKSKSKKRRQRTRGSPSLGRQGLAPEGRTLPPAAARESVEDPLEDWAEDDAEADRWLLEREAEDVQRGDG